MTPVQNLRLPVKGLPPLAEPLAGAAIEALLHEEDELDAAEHAANRSTDPARLRASDAYACARKVAFSSIGLPKDIQYDAQQIMTFRQGDFFHDVVQRALIKHFDARTEVDFDLRPKISLYGRCDAVVKLPDGRTIVVEIKSQSGYGFDVAVGSRKGRELPGPKVEHMLQPGLAAISDQIAAQAVLVLLVNKDRSTVAEWLIDLDEPLPHVDQQPTLRQMLDKEIERLHGVLARIDKGELPRRVVPGYGIVDKPAEAGSRDDPWQCRYCSWQPTCAQLEAGVVPDGVAVVLRGKGVAA